MNDVMDFRRVVSEKNCVFFILSLEFLLRKKGDLQLFWWEGQL